MMRCLLALALIAVSFGVGGQQNACVPILMSNPPQCRSAYTMITVTYGGSVGHSRDYQSLRMCQQARSLALTGMTIEANAVAEEEWLKRLATRGNFSSTGPAFNPSNGEEVILLHGAWVRKYKHDVKHAECVIETQP